MSASPPAWQPMLHAPRNAPVRLFLPAAKFEMGENGRPKPETVQHDECVGIWDAAQTAWVNQATGAKVYPSKWQPL